MHTEALKDVNCSLVSNVEKSSHHSVGRASDIPVEKVTRQPYCDTPSQCLLYYSNSEYSPEAPDKDTSLVRQS